MHRTSTWTCRARDSLLLLAIIPSLLGAQARERGAASQQGAAASQVDANGIKVGDAVEVLTGFGWTPAKVLAISGNSYRVMTNGIAVTKDYPSEVRRVGGAARPPAATAKAGVPPRPGMASCAGKIEGRYATTGSAMGSFTIRFRSGTATMTDAGGNDEVFECWTAGDRIILRQPSHPNMDMSIDINDDHSLQTPIGEIRKKGS
jgi:hypothetical protein